MNFRGRVCETKIIFLYFGTRGGRLWRNLNESERSMQAWYICLFNPSKSKDRKGEVLKF